MFFSSQPISWHITEETKPNATKANIHPEHKNTTTQNKHTKKLKAGLFASYGLQPGNGAGRILQLPGPTWSKQAVLYSSQGPLGAVLLSKMVPDCGNETDLYWPTGLRASRSTLLICLPSNNCLEGLDTCYGVSEDRPAHISRLKSEPPCALRCEPDGNIMHMA